MILEQIHAAKEKNDLRSAIALCRFACGESMSLAKSAAKGVERSALSTHCECWQELLRDLLDDKLAEFDTILSADALLGAARSSYDREKSSFSSPKRFIRELLELEELEVPMVFNYKHFAGFDFVLPHGAVSFSSFFDEASGELVHLYDN